jgi:SAM-dependent methyltransferase
MITSESVNNVGTNFASQFADASGEPFMDILERTAGSDVLVTPDPPARCFLCGGQSDHALWHENGYSAMQCECGVLYASPTPPIDAVDPTEDPHLASFYDLPAAMKVDWLRRHKPAGRLLEVGCGDGYFLAAARARGYDVAAIEAHGGRATRIREKFGIEVEHALVEETRWPENSCDIVFHCDLLSHFPDPIRALRRMRGLLRPDGVMYFEVGVVADLSPFWYRLMATIQMPAHRWLYTEQALETMLDRAGFRIERVRRYGLAPAYLMSRFGRLIGYGGGATTPADSGQRSGASCRRRYRPPPSSTS